MRRDSRDPLGPVLHNLQEITHRVAELVASYRQKLVEGGIPEHEAWATAQRLERRILDPLFDQAEGLVRSQKELSDCPSCGSDAIHATPLESSMLGVCLACGHVWGADGALDETGGSPESTPGI